MPKPPTQPARLAWRVAGRLRDQLHQRQLQRLAYVTHDRNDLSTYLERWQRLSRQIDVASRRRWLGALSYLKLELDYLFTSVQNELNVARRITADHHEPVIPSMSDLVGDLGQIEDDFGEWSYDHRTGVLSVSTEPITLEGIDLGRFAIKLEIRRLADVDAHRIYRVEALEANPAEGNDGVTHPHVKDDELCEGHAAAAIKAALTQGRLADFYMLVNSVLRTYNAESPYVALDRWHGGMSCHDCGDHVSEDDRCSCGRCDHDFCSDCTSSCRCCRSYYCGDCMRTCPCCEESVCEGCVTACDECDEAVCEHCLESGICKTCREKNHDDTNQQPEPAASGSAPTAGSAGGNEDGDCKVNGLGLPIPEEANPEPDPAILALCLVEAAGVPRRRANGNRRVRRRPQRRQRASR